MMKEVKEIKQLTNKQADEPITSFEHHEENINETSEVSSITNLSLSFLVASLCMGTFLASLDRTIITVVSTNAYLPISNMVQGADTIHSQSRKSPQTSKRQQI
jgi:hypothetical protein